MALSLPLCAGGALTAYALYCPLLALSQKYVPGEQGDYNFLAPLMPSVFLTSGAFVNDQNLAAVLLTGLAAGGGAKYMGWI